MTTEESPKVEPIASPEPTVKPEPTAKPRMTEAAFVEELQALLKRGDEAGLNPVNIITRVVFRRGVNMLDGFLATLEKDIGGGKKG